MRSFALLQACSALAMALWSGRAFATDPELERDANGGYAPDSGHSLQLSPHWLAAADGR